MIFSRHTNCLLTTALLGVLVSVGAAAPAEEADPFAPYDDGTPDGYMIIQGDMLVPIDYYERREAGPTIQGGFYYNLWPAGVVPYEFDSNVTAENQQTMRLAMNEIQDVCAAIFVPRAGHDDYVHIQAHASENNSEVGHQGGEQIINITSWGSRFTMVHELMHTLGFKHEQSRPDRDNYVVIHEDRIKDGKEDNFDKDGDIISYGPYDFGSLMHYGQCAFSNCCTADSCAPCYADLNNCRTIGVEQPWTDDWQDEIGQKDGFSKGDVATLQCLYPELFTVFVDHDPSQYWHPLLSPLLPLGSFLNPFPTFGEGEAAVLPLGTVIIQPGQYAAVGIHGKPMMLKGPLGGVKLGQ